MGFGHSITINGRPILVDGPEISHEQICDLAEEPHSASVTYRGSRDGDSERSGTTHKGKSIKVEDGMRFSCIRTGNA